jgi:hypothetical protein
LVKLLLSIEIMSFLGLTAVERPWCIGCEAWVHDDFLPTDFCGGDEFPIISTTYTCPHCGLEMWIESHGGGMFNVYPNEDTLP